MSIYSNFSDRYAIFSDCSCFFIPMLRNPVGIRLSRTGSFQDRRWEVISERSTCACRLSKYMNHCRIYKPRCSVCTHHYAYWHKWRSESLSPFEGIPLSLFSLLPLSPPLLKSNLPASSFGSDQSALLYWTWYLSSSASSVS